MRYLVRARVKPGREADLLEAIEQEGQRRRPALVRAGCPTLEPLSCPRAACLNGVVPGLVVNAPAKLNLVLRVGEREPDGYHAILSLVTRVDVADTLMIAPALRTSAIAAAGCSACLATHARPPSPIHSGVKAAAA